MKTQTKPAQTAQPAPPNPPAPFQTAAITPALFASLTPGNENDRQLVETIRQSSILLVHAADKWLGRTPTIQTRRERRIR